MANLQVNQIRKHLTDNYIRFVDASDIIGSKKISVSPNRQIA